MQKFHLITRPLEAALTFQQLLIENSQHCLINPLLKVTFDLEGLINFISNENLTNCSFIVTSPNSLKALKQGKFEDFKSVDLIVSSSISMKEAENFNFKSAIQVGTQALDIEKYLQYNYSTNTKYIYLCGEDITVKIDEALTGYGLNIKKVVVYKTEALHLTEFVIANFKRNLIKSVSLFSYKTAQIFIQEIEVHNLADYLSSINFYTISYKIANFLRSKLPTKKIIVSNCYNSKSMVDLVIKEV